MKNGAKRVALAGFIIAPLAAFTLGGWATITVEDLPEYAVSGTPVKLTYTVRQHGISLLGGLSGAVTAKSGDTEFRITPGTSGSGTYVSTVTFARPGNWDVEVHSGFFSSKVNLLPLTVVARDAAAPAPMSSANLGRHLFVAKGCVTCHSHQLTKSNTSLRVGPDLSEPKFVSAYLTKFLADPSIKTTWANTARMPNLGLKPAEISALVAFLNRESVASR